MIVQGLEKFVDSSVFRIFPSLKEARALSQFSRRDMCSLLSNISTAFSNTFSLREFNISQISRNHMVRNTFDCSE